MYQLVTSPLPTYVRKIFKTAGRWQLFFKERLPGPAHWVRPHEDTTTPALVTFSDTGAEHCAAQGRTSRLDVMRQDRQTPTPSKGSLGGNSGGARSFEFRHVLRSEEKLLHAAVYGGSHWGRIVRRNFHLGCDVGFQIRQTAPATTRSAVAVAASGHRSPCRWALICRSWVCSSSCCAITTVCSFCISFNSIGVSI